MLETPRLIVSPIDRTRLRLESGCDEGTIRNWAKGLAVTPATNARLTKAAIKLGLLSARSRCDDLEEITMHAAWQVRCRHCGAVDPD